MDSMNVQAGARHLLNSEGCTVLGSVGVGGSITLLLLIGFTAGAVTSSLLFWWRERRRMRIELEYRNRYGDAVRAGLPDVSAMVKAAHTPTIARSVAGALTAGPAGDASAAELGQCDTGALLAKAASALGAQDGPLAMGAASSFKQAQAAAAGDTLRQALSAKEQHHPNHTVSHTNPLAAMAPSEGGAPSVRSSAGNPFTAEVPSFRVRRNEACSLNNTPSSSINGLPAAPGSPGARRPQPGLIGTGVYVPASDPSSPRITQQAAALGGPMGAAAAASPFAWAPLPQAAAATGAAAPPPQPVHGRSDTVVVKPGVSGGAGLAPAAAPAPGPLHATHSSSDYLAALDSTGTNPFETPALRRQQEEEGGAAALAGHAMPRATPGPQAPSVGAPQAAAAAAAEPAAAAKAAHKRELLDAVQGEEYGDEELDPEWAQLLGELDERLQAAGRPRLTARERAVAIRSLIVATASQSADAALGKAQHDVEAFRRAQSLRSGVV